jgi:hypothetical protein
MDCRVLPWTASTPPYFLATGKSFSPQKRISSGTSKHEIFKVISVLWVIFALLDTEPDPADQNQLNPCGSGSENVRKICSDWPTFTEYFLQAL